MIVDQLPLLFNIEMGQLLLTNTVGLKNAEAIYQLVPQQMMYQEKNLT